MLLNEFLTQITTSYTTTLPCSVAEKTLILSMGEQHDLEPCTAGALVNYFVLLDAYEKVHGFNSGTVEGSLLVFEKAMTVLSFAR